MIDLYAGLGGFTQGAIEAGAEVILSIDFWDEAIKVHKANHPSIPCWQMKLGSPTDYKIINQVIEKYRKTHHIHIHGSPPCQALSNASRRDAGEGMPLIIHYLELIELLKPDSWSMENVVPMRKRLPEGTPSVVLNSADFGVPQTRRRCIAGEGWIAQPTHTKDEWVSVIQALPHLEEELIRLQPVPSMTKQYNTASKNKPYPTVTSQSPQQLKLLLRGYSRTRPVMKNGVHTGVNTPRIPPDGCISLDESSYTVCSSSMELWKSPTELLMDSGRANAKTTGINPRTGKKEGGSGALFRSLDKPSYTIMSSPRTICVNTAGATNSTSKGATTRDREISKPSGTLSNQTPTIRSIKLEALGSNAKRSNDRSILEPSKTICGSGNQVGARIFNHEEKPEKIRSLTIEETLTLQGFSPEYDLSSTRLKKDKWTMIGNAVCPAVAKAIIEGIES